MINGDFRLLIGLGNPGSKYTGTRHNIGFSALQRLAEKEHVLFRHSKKIHGHIAEIGIGTDSSVKILLPNTYMNESGRSIRAALDWFDLSVNQLVVLADDMDLPLGRLRLRTKGSSGGHNGLKSIINHLGTQEFCRIKIGIGAPAFFPEDRKEKTIPHVLGTFTSKEMPMVNDVLNEVIEGLDLLQKLGIERAGNHLNSYKPKDFPIQQ